MGSDTVQKQELDPSTLLKADVVISDSLSQSVDRGEIHHALKDGLDMNSVVELGEVISNKINGRTSDKQITVADLTGVAVQDIQIAKAVLSYL
jgi:ornithine cyclodeaminase